MKRHTQKQLLHLFAGLLIVVIAFHFFERGEILQATILFGAGCVFLILAGAHTWIEKNIRRISSFFFFLEALTFYYAADLFHTLGHKQYYQWLTGATVLFVLFGIFYVLSKRGKYHNRKTKSMGKAPAEF